MSQPESRLSRAIMNRLRAMGIFCFKVHGGPTMQSGLPDIIACVPACLCTRVTCTRHPNLPRVGLFIGFETKTPAGDDPSPIQVRVHEQIRDAHGQVFVVRSVQDAVDALDRLGYPTIPPRTR